jgi:hypothetical protein
MRCKILMSESSLKTLRDDLKAVEADENEIPDEIFDDSHPNLRDLRQEKNDLNMSIAFCETIITDTRIKINSTKKSYSYFSNIVLQITAQSNPQVCLLCLGLIVEGFVLAVFPCGHSMCKGIFLYYLIIYRMYGIV